MRRDIGSGYAPTGDRSAIRELSRRLGIDEWQAEMALADKGFMRALVEDVVKRPSPTTPVSVIPKTSSGRPKGTGWVNGQELAPPPGQDIIAALCDRHLGPAVPKPPKE